MVVGEANGAGTFNMLRQLECNSQNKNQLQRSGLKEMSLITTNIPDKEQLLP